MREGERERAKEKGYRKKTNGRADPGKEKKGKERKTKSVGGADAFLHG